MRERSANPIKLWQIEEFGLWEDPEEIPFTDTSTATIANYDLDYLETFGPYPTVMLLVDEGDGNFREKEQRPLRVMTDGVLTSLVWDFGDPISGLIILKK